MNLVCGTSSALWRRERVIPFLHDMEGHRTGHLVDVRAKLLGSSKYIPRPLYNQHRCADSVEVRHAKLRRLARRMQRIAKHDEASESSGDVIAGSGQMRRDPPAHRFPSDEQRVRRDVRLRGDCSDGRAITGFERVGPIRQSALLLHVEKIECDDVHASRRKPVRPRDHERARLPGASSVRKDKSSVQPM